MKRSINILRVMFFAVFSLFGAGVISAASGLDFGVIAVGMGALSFIPMPNGVALMAIQKENWLQDVVEALFKKSPHLDYAYNADMFVLDGKVVHIPNSGAVTDPTRNRTSLPATVVTRTDADITFSIDEFTTAPVLIKNAEEVELSYDKRQSVMGMHLNDLAGMVGDWMLYHWAPSTLTQMVRTTGSAVLSHTGSATGNRKAITLADVKSANKMLNKNSVPQGDRYALLDADMYDQFTSDLDANSSRDFSQYFDAEKGIVGKLYGFTFLDPRATALIYTNASTPVVKEPGAAGATTDNAAGLFWHKDAVIRAIGTKDFFENENDATYFGSVISCLVRASGRKRRNDAKGVVAIVQAASA